MGDDRQNWKIRLFPLSHNIGMRKEKEGKTLKAGIGIRDTGQVDLFLPTGCYVGSQAIKMGYDKSGLSSQEKTLGVKTIGNKHMYKTTKDSRWRLFWNPGMSTTMQCDDKTNANRRTYVEISPSGNIFYRIDGKHHRDTFSRLTLTSNGYDTRGRQNR